MVISGVLASAAMSISGRLTGVSDEPISTSTFSSAMSLRAFCAPLVGSDSSSSAKVGDFLSGDFLRQRRHRLALRLAECGAGSRRTHGDADLDLRMRAADAQHSVASAIIQLCCVTSPSPFRLL